MWRSGLGLAGQWLGCWRAWTAGQVRHDRIPHDSNSGERGRPLDRSDRAVATDLSQYSSGTVEERHYDSAEVINRGWANCPGPDCQLHLAELWSNNGRNFGDDFGKRISIGRDRIARRYAGHERRRRK